ncbi:MAG: FAD-dependent oxidoreductase [Candidatus Caenarcaniphilales bacterium]|nr:FAD-dependent oxidoreductase [Candidatus Caenarcaniphilales bacterium]
MLDSDFYDFIVVGAGLAGLAEAALLAKDGYRVKLLEAHTVSGGCASYFKRKNFLFDVGATTLSGIQKHQPLGKLISELDLEDLKLKKMDLAMKVYQDGEVINRYADKDLWIDELIRVFCDPADGDDIKHMKAFWQELYDIEKDAWGLLELHPNLLPVTLKDLLSILDLRKVSDNFKALKYVPSLFLSIRTLLKKFKLDKNEKFIDFLDEQLIISTQNDVDKTPEFMGALGLTYASDIYYPYGGIHTVSEAIEKAFLKSGGEIQFKSEVTDIETIKMNREKIFFVKDKSEREFLSNHVISNLPVWNMLNLTSSSTRDFFKKYAKRFEYNTSAFTLYFGVECEEDFGTSYFQIICPEIIPNCSAKSFFVTMSQLDDELKAPAGWRSITISTHTDADFWLNLDSETYKKKKNETQNYIFKLLFENIPSLREAEKEFITSSSSKSFEFFTRRKSGLVGGIPHSVEHNVLELMPKKVRGEKIYLVGDTVFPGQGLVATAYSALSLRETLKLNGID